MGGVEKVVKEVCKRLSQKKEYNIKVYSTSVSLKLLGSHNLGNVKVRNYLAFAPFNAYYIPSVGMLVDLLKEKNAIFHLYGVHDVTAIAGFLTKRKNRLIVSPYYHGRGHSKIAEKLWFIYRPLIRRLLQKADAIIVNSKVQKKLLLRDFSIASKKFYTIYDGVALNDIRNVKPYERNDKIILYVGRLERYKNVHIGVYALKYLPDEFKYVIVGKGGFERRLKMIVKDMNVQSRVLFLGSQPDDIVWRWLKTASVFLHLSDIESFGMTCIESLAAGTPVVANDDGAGLMETINLYPKEILVYRVRREPIQKLASLIIKASEMKPLKVDVSRFSWENIVEQISSIYKDVYYK